MEAEIGQRGGKRLNAGKKRAAGPFSLLQYNKKIGQLYRYKKRFIVGTDQQALARQALYTDIDLAFIEHGVEPELLNSPRLRNDRGDAFVAALRLRVERPAEAAMDGPAGPDDAVAVPNFQQAGFAET